MFLTFLLYLLESSTATCVCVCTCYVVYRQKMDAQLIETCSVIDDLAKVFQTSDDVELVHNIQQGQEKLKTMCEQNYAETKKIIKGMSCIVCVYKLPAATQ